MLSQLATQPATRLVRTNRQTKNHYSIDKKLVATLNLLEFRGSNLARLVSRLSKDGDFPGWIS